MTRSLRTYSCYVAVLTSRYTLDSASDRARREMAARAELVGALRLPSQAFSRVAGTQVVTDLLVFRVRDPEHAALDEHPTWLDTTTTVVADPASGATDELTINAYYLDNLENVLGTPQLGRGLHGSPTLAIDGVAGELLAGQLADRLAVIVDRAVARGRGLTATADSLTVVAEHPSMPGWSPPPTAARRPRCTRCATTRKPAASSTGPATTGSRRTPRKPCSPKPVSSSSCATSRPA